MSQAMKIAANLAWLAFVVYLWNATLSCWEGMTVLDLQSFMFSRVPASYLITVGMVGFGVMGEILISKWMEDS